MQAMVKMKINNKAQLKIQQMAFMLMAVTLFFVLAGMFVLIIQFSWLKESATKLEEENAMLLVAKIANSPEFACGSAFGSDRTDCIDFDKIMMLKQNIDKYEKVSNNPEETFWGVATNIEIRKIYPKTDADVICSIENYPDCNIIKIGSGKISAEYPNFVSLCRKESFEGDIYDRCELAKIMINYKDWRTE